MPKLQPNIMIMDRFNQNCPDTGAACAQSIRKDLIPCQSAPAGIYAVLFKTLFYTFGERLFCVGDTVDAVFLAENFHPVLMTIGHHTKLDVALGHILEPILHFFSGYIGGIGHDGIIEIQHQ